MNRRRDHGELVFIDLRDRSGIAQVVFDARFVPVADLLEKAKELRSEFVLDVTGAVVERDGSSVNRELPTGEIEVRATALSILNRADTPPFPIEDGIKASEDLRLTHRYLDLRRPEMTKKFMTRSAVTMAIREVMHAEGFLDVETPILTKSTPEGARDFLVPSRVHEGEFYALPQSPQLFKQLLMVAGMERYYQIARCFRDEDLRADRQPEFTQVDIEMSFPSEEAVFALVEKLFTKVFPAWGIPCEAPFRRMTYDEAMERYGIDRPDTRFALELGDFAALEEHLSSKVERVKGLCVPGGGSFSRKRLDDLEKGARAAGVEWFFWVKTAAAGSWNSNSKKIFSDASVEKLRAAFGAGNGDLVLLAAGKAKSVFDFLGALRVQIAREEKLVPEGRYEFLWVTGFPLLEWHEEDARWYAMHHPFTSPREEDLPFLEIGSRAA